ncbi:MAG TPA: hypothetical protein VFB74_26915 [Kribbellaceae bacterium]|nr:hypothetical protein [Kribbellaceae bacterium]
MSTVFDPARTRSAPSTGRVVRPARPRLTVVDDRPFRPPRMPFVLFVVALLGAGLVGLLLLNTSLQQGTFRVTELNQQAKDLRDQQEELERQVQVLEAPQNLADRALRLGMVPNPNPVFLRLSDGKVLGVPAQGQAGSGATVFGPQLPNPVKPAVKPPVKPALKPPVKPALKPGTAPTQAMTPTPTTKPTQPARTGTARTADPTGPTRPALPPKPGTVTTTGG